MKKIALHWQVLIAMALGAVAGLSIKAGVMPAGDNLLSVCALLGTLFMNALKLIVIPLVVSSVIVGVSSATTGLGRMGGLALSYYISTSMAAILTGTFWVNLLTPGIANGKPASDLLALPTDTAGALAKIEGRSIADFSGSLLQVIPDNLAAAATQGNMLGLLFFSLLFGYFVAKLADDQRQAQRLFWSGVQTVVMNITHLVLRFTPLGVFALITKVFAQTGFAAIQPLMVFFVTVLLALATHLFINMSLVLRFLARVSPRQHLRAMLPALLTAFSTASSNATLPVTLRNLRERAGVSERVSGMTVPLGATINMDGTALYECVAALFIAQAYGLELGFLQQALVVFLALLTSTGVAGIPAASLVAIAVILGALGLPLEAIGILLITDRLLDMCRSAVNVYSDSVAAVLVASREGEALLPLRQPWRMNED